MFTKVLRPIPLPGFGGGSGDAPKRRRLLEALPTGLMKRSGGSCEIQLQECKGSASAVFRRTRKGGDRLAAILHVCPSCANAAVRAGKQAYKFGLLLKKDQDPARTPVLYRSEMSVLADDGSVTASADRPTAGFSLPLRAAWRRLRLPLRPWMVLGVVVAVGAALSARAPWWFVAGTGLALVPAVHFGGYLMLVRLDDTQPGLTGWPRIKAFLAWARHPAAAMVTVPERREAVLRRRQRAATYIAAAAAGWLLQANLGGLSGRTLGGRLAWTELALVFLVAAPPYWRHVRVRPAEPTPEPEPDPVDDVDELEQAVRNRWAEQLSNEGGKAAGTRLKNWRRVFGGWGATVRTPEGSGFDFERPELKRAIAQAFGVGLTAIGLEIDPDDAGQAHLLVQKNDPLRGVVRTKVPDTVDAERGTGVGGRYCDGTWVSYEVYRPGWGSPHVAAIGMTGSGKSEFLNETLKIERWMHYLDTEGTPQGMVCSLLVDPQEGQSFAPFLDDLAAPVASTIDEALMLVEALNDEMRRRNHYLTHEAKWWDEKRRIWRTGRKWWNPMVDGPILALTIDEAHEFFSYGPFVKAVTKGARMWRKCGGQVKFGNHNLALTDLGGSAALREMISVYYVFKTDSNITKQSAFGGRLSVDPRQIPDVPGMCYVMAKNSRGIKARAPWEEDYYDVVRDEHNQPIGYPASLPEIARQTMGVDFRNWDAARRCGELWTPGGTEAKPVDLAAANRDRIAAKDACLDVLRRATGPMQFGDIVKASGFSTRSCTGRLGELVKEGRVATEGGKYWLIREVISA